MALDIDWEDVCAMAPELAAVSEAAQEQVLKQVNVRVSVGKFGSPEKAEIAGLALARHLGSMALPGWNGGQGPVASVTVGSVSKSFAVKSDQNDWRGALALTKWGLEYLEYCRLWVGGMRVL